MITVEFENPANPSAGVRTWQRSRASRAHSATRSDLTLPLTKNAAEIRSIISVAIISVKLGPQRYSNYPNQSEAKDINTALDIIS
jgi:hypothetical protein